MKLYKLLKNVKCRVLGSCLIEIETLCHNDKDVNVNSLFFCLSGTKDDGVNYVYSAVKNGAVAVVLEKEIKGLTKVTQILVKNARIVMSLISQNFYGNPAKNFKLIGVTGTNGKTTTTYMMSSLLNSLKYKTAIIGTNGVVFDGKIIETGMTTPDPIVLNRILKMLVDLGVLYVCMEVSAHSIYLRKLDGLVFDLIIFTNLTEDHLDFFKNMRCYFDAKKRIFQNKYARQALINVDDEFGLELFNCINMKKKAYSIYNKSDYKAKNLGIKNYFQNFMVDDNFVSSKFLGEFNIYNLLAAIAGVEMLNIKINNIQELVDMIECIPGRFNVLVIKQKLFIIDYAHTPDGLENVLKLCKSIVEDKKLICVFGCGGNRETQKRAKMGEISSKYADFTIITSDNPRFEKRENIAKDIENGVIGNQYKIILNRADAIKYADNIARNGDVVLIAGKGCENYIDELGVKTRYSDYEEVEKLRK